MSEWWTYRLSDFLMFSPRSYRRLFELVNADVWPAQLLALAAGTAVLAALWRRHRHAAAWAFAVLALAWALVGWAFHWRRFEPINWAAAGFAVAFGVQALILAVASRAATRAAQPPGQPEGAARRVGLGLLLAALLWPLIAAAAGRAWPQAPVFGVAPDPTVLATLGVLLLAPQPGGGSRRTRLLRAAALWLLPLSWCAVGGAMAWTLDESDAALLPAAAAVALWLHHRQRAAVAAQERELPAG